MSANMTLTSKLAAIGEEIGAMAKTGKNTGFGGGYNFIEYGEVAGKIRSLFAKYNVMIFPEIVDYEKTPISSKQGTAGFHYNLVMKFTIVNGDDQSDRFESPWLSESNDFGDKGVNKAITAGTKYFIMRLFNISEKGDDPDSETVEVASTAPAPTAPSGSRPATQKQLDYLGSLLDQLNVPEEDRAKTLELAKSAKACSNFIEAARKRLEEAENGGN